MEKSCVLYDRVSTGINGFDKTIDMLRLGDNVVWQVDSVDNYRHFVNHYIKQARLDKRKIVYMRFGCHISLIDDTYGIRVYDLNADEGFESFGTKVHDIITEEGLETFYVFDCLSELLRYWHSDLMIGNFFKITCPYLYELNTVAYFAIMRNTHTYSTIARIRETTQVLLDLYQIKNEYYVHPLKVWERYSPTMFIPHRSKNGEFSAVTSSSDLAALFVNTSIQEERKDYWDRIFDDARDTLFLSIKEQEEAKNLLISLLIGRGRRITTLSNKYFTLSDLINIHARQIGTGFIGGKSVGMLLARKVLETDGGDRFTKILEQHDSFYLGSDIFYTYIVQNRLWKLRTKQKKMSGYFKYASEMRQKILNGKFPEIIREKFQQMLEYFGQSPIIVRSSSLLEDNFGNAFAGKYESVFCVNQGTPQQRYEEFAKAVRIVYASTLSDDALAYRLKRGLFDRDEQMALLVQRVSGDYHGDYFFPHIAGVGNSSNIYVWDKSMDVEAGMLRLVFGMGTRAVDRIMGDYPRLVSLDNPEQTPLVYYDDEAKFSQSRVDVLCLKDNVLTDRALEDIMELDIGTNKEMFVKKDYKTIKRMKELGIKNRNAYILGFKELLSNSEFPSDMKAMLSVLSEKYDYPVDIEFTANFTQDGDYKINLVQCRPLQTKGLGNAVEMPELLDPSDCLFNFTGNFMGGNVRLPIDYAVIVDSKSYIELPQSEKYTVARHIGAINSALKDSQVMLIGPGRWGTTTPSLGVPVSFAELCNMSIICEVAYNLGGLMPELSFGSHFFQDLVESDIFYAAIFDGYENVIYNPEYLTNTENHLEHIISPNESIDGVIHIAKIDGLEIYSDIVSQRVICK
ncbi:pyruvate kinase [Alkalibaculum sp. M08DMB]|uniref:Phosphoenolpyruvate synthase n=1 Tax=Alkalibaculum sporogenes TaxID=2655001 RepID=A0A6A7K8G8_9FIRM|nr:PEP/pyruvate-binding domain-containing protein [Alkalibaculum sporogenes]MPW25740.1 pyruvate kinase [Alkalibaculum sporogenes]